MKITIPIYVQQRRNRGTTPPITVRPLFFPEPVMRGTELGKVIAKLTNKLRVELAPLARESDHQQLLQWHEADMMDDRLVKLSLDLRDRTANLKLLLVSMIRHGRRLVFSPTLFDSWFDVEEGESIETRAAEVYESYFRKIRKDRPEYPVEHHSIEGKAWVDYVTIEVMAQKAQKKAVDPLRALLGGQDVSDGASQLRQVGRCLNWVDIDELCDPISVGDDVQRLMHLMEVGDRRGVVLVGPSGSGKTARIEGAVRRRRLRSKSATRGQVWHLSPARLISGMSYLGQWQERVLGILKHAYRYDHILYFDDLLGLYEAGKCRDSSMCVADTLRAQLDIRPVRLLAEMTPEAWAILRERDRTLADRMVVVPTEALDTRRTMETLVGIQRKLEANGKLFFDTDVIPEIVSLYDRFDRSSVLPGKAAAALYRLAARPQGRMVNRELAINEFQSRSGLLPSMIDRRQALTRVAMDRSIRQSVVGQDAAVEKLIDRIMIAAAQMNDTNRPLGTFLLVGPTGVGKTQLAKAVAECMFDSGGLIRLDMNELSSPASASRLIGTFDAPDGMLTSAVRRRPHAVLLLDEIEKAHPTVLDVLLHAIGEARLSDARGRTVDLSGLLILMTSNLGSRQSGRGSGFSDVTDEKVIGDVHRKAAQEFFRPEFFNRIDDVLSFERLSTETMESIAWMQLDDVLQRDGLQRRSVLIDVDEAAIKWTASRGYDPSMGARALKRQIERDLVGPASQVLASTPTDQPTILRLYLDGESVQTRWQPIEYAKPVATDANMPLTELLRRSQLWLDEIADEIEGVPLSFELGGEGVDPKQFETMTLRDSLLECRQTLRKLTETQQKPKLQKPQSTPVPVPGSSMVGKRFEPNSTIDMRDLQAVDDIMDYLQDSLVDVDSGELDETRDQFLNEMGRLHGQLSARGMSHRWALSIRWYGRSEFHRPSSEWSKQWPEVDSYVEPCIVSSIIHQWMVGDENLVADASRDVCFYIVQGALAKATIDHLLGGWLIVRPTGEFLLAEVSARPLDANESDDDAHQRWMNEPQPERISPIRRVLQSGGPLVDLVSGAAVSQSLGQVALMKLVRQSRRSVEFLPDHKEATK